LRNLPHNHIFRGKRYRITTATDRTLGGLGGDCDAPTQLGKVIRINKDLMKPDMNQELMEILLHEGLHACIWDASESTVQETAESLAKLLWKCGYRRIMEL